MMWQNILASSIVMIGFLVIMVVIYGLLNAKGIKGQKQHFEKIHQEISQGNHVILANGIHGIVRKIENETVDLEIKSGAIMTVSRFAISEIV